MEGITMCVSKRIFISLIGAITLLACMIQCKAICEDDFKKQFSYAVLSDHAKIIDVHDREITEINIPNMIEGKKVTEILESAFFLCQNLKVVSLPDSLNLKMNIFGMNPELTNIVLTNNHPTLIFENGVLYNIENETEIVAVLRTYQFKHFRIPENIRKIDRYAFIACDSLESIEIPDNVKDIEANAFSCCYNLSSVVIPNSVSELKDSTFSFCESLESIIIPDSITTIGKEAFLGCKKLETIIIPDSVTTINDQAFKNCRNLSSVKIPDSVKSIGKDVFPVNCVLNVVKGSYAEKYCQDNKIEYILSE